MLDRQKLAQVSGRMAVELHALATVTKAGMLGPEPPAKLRTMLHGLRSYGPLAAPSWWLQSGTATGPGWSTSWGR
jgi:hypothetical protein